MTVTFCMDIPGVKIPTSETQIVRENFPFLPRKGDEISIERELHPGELTRGVHWWVVSNIVYSLSNPERVSVGVRPARPDDD